MNALTITTTKRIKAAPLSNKGMDKGKEFYFELKLE